jgi:lysozyme family protein
MAQSSYDQSLKRLLAHEGGYTNDPHDPGGPTNFGITIYDYRKYVKPGATPADVRAMPLQVAKDIYKAKYWDALRGDELPAGVDDSVFDYGVNSGIIRAGRVLRRVLGLSTGDWHTTDAVLNELNRHNAASVVRAINAERLHFLQNLRTWPIFGRGWGRRVAEVLAFDLKLAAGLAPPANQEPAQGKASHTIKETQDAMNRLGISQSVLGTNLLVDGIKGVKTDSVVEAYQRAKGLVVDGIPGIATWHEITDDLDKLNAATQQGTPP